VIRPAVLYASEPDLARSEFRRVLAEAGLGAIRPVDDPARLQAMLDNAGLIVTARLDTAERPLVGIARSITDHAWCCYLSDLAVCGAAQRMGIGQGLLDETRRQLGSGVTLVLISVDDALGFYERAGMTRLRNAFWRRRER
jgi:ribosomal protein S18 acetylase RimI-like enzyme